MTSKKISNILESLCEGAGSKYRYEKQRAKFIYPFERYITTKEIFRGIIFSHDLQGSERCWMSSGGDNFYGYDYEVFEVAQEYLFQMQC